MKRSSHAVPAALAIVTLLASPACAPAQQSRQTETPPPVDIGLRTPGEVTNWTALSPHEAVLGFYRDLQATSPYVRTFHLGWSRERREMLAVTIANPAVTTPAEAHATGKPIVFIAAQVHGDEPAGKEGLMLFARDIATGPLAHLLDRVIFVLVPQINPDGGAAGEWGTRENPAGYNLNRDYILLENPETRAIVNEGIVRWSPHVIIDAHEARGPPRYYDFYTSYPRNGYGPSAIVRFTENEALPALVGAMEAAGFTHYFYHTIPSGLARDPSRGITRGGGGARSLSSYGGGAGAITFLFESLRQQDSRIGIERRARMHWTAMSGLSEFVATNADRVIATIAEARREMNALGTTWDPADSVFVRSQYRVTGTRPYRLWEGGQIVEIDVAIRDEVMPLKGYVRPEAYLVEAHREEVAAHLALHGITVERTLAPVRVEVESYRVEGVSRSDPYESIIERDFQITLVPGTVEFPAGSWLIRANQLKAALAIHMLEPEDNDSLASAGWFINSESSGAILPVHRVRRLPPVATQVR